MNDKKHIIVGVFVLVGAILLGTMIVWFEGVAIFVRGGYTVYTHLDSAIGIRAGKRVHLDGIEVGEVVAVKSAEPERRGVWLDLRITPGTNIPENARFVAQQSAVGGDAFMDFQTVAPAKNFLKDKVRIQRARRLFAEVPMEKFAEIFDYAVKKMRFQILCTITGVDLGASLGLIYHLARESGVMLNLVTSVPKERPVLQTVTGYFPAAEAYERELADLFGFQVQGLPEGPRYPLPDDWPGGQFPLRKDWKSDALRPARSESEAQDARP